MIRGPVLLAVVILAGGSANAGVIFTLGNVPLPGEQNILFNSAQSGSMITGITNQTNTIVDFSSSTDTLVVDANGQAQLVALDGTLNGVSITLAGGGGYQSLVLNPFMGGDVAAGPATVTVAASDGTFTYTYPGGLGKGQNFLTITASGGDTILSTTIDAPAGFQDLQQPRISASSTAAVPEPWSGMLLAGGLLAFCLGRPGRRNSERRQ